MTIAERILIRLSRDPAAPDHAAAVPAWDDANALAALRAAFPELRARMEGARIVDFGCGGGWQAVALAEAGAAFVLGVDINPRSLASARALAARRGLGPGRVAFVEAIPGSQRGSFDFVISQDSMEHFLDPEAVLREMRAALRPGGRLLVSFGPPWYAPSGSHMHFFTAVPWVNLLFSEETVMRVRSRYRSDGATRYEEVESGLNRMSVGRFERLLERCGMEVAHREYRCVKGWNWLGRVPGARELFINQVVCALALPAGREAMSFEF